MNKIFSRASVALVVTLMCSVSVAQTTPVSTYGYNASGQLATMGEGNGQSHAFYYNAFGELSLHQQPAASATVTAGQVAYGYNGQGRAVSVTDPRSLVTSYDVDGFGRLKVLGSPDTGTAYADYDEAGNRTSHTDARGQSATTEYDALNRLTALHYGDSSLTFGYDAGFGVGQMTSMSDVSGSTSWSYDKLSRVTGKTQTTGSVQLSVGYSYFPGGKVASITYPSGNVVGFTYDGANVASITVNGVTAVSNVAYFPFGAPKSWTMGTIGSYARQADVHGRITSHTSEAGTRTLTWDASSRLTSVAETGQAGRSYDYDGLNRLVGATEAAARGYAYDLTGNRTNETVNGTSYTYGVDTASNRLDSSANEVHSASYQFDLAGNTLSDGARTYAYNDAGQLVTATSFNGTAQYAYNGLGNRVFKSTTSGDKHFLYAEDGVSLLGEYGAAGATAPVSETVYLGDMPVLVLKGSAVYYILPDHLAAPRVIKDQAGAVVWRWQSDAFGNGVANESPSGGTPFVFNQRFPGQQYDAETGLHYNNARYYDPQVGRYITSDPIGLGGGLNTYGYALQSPSVHTDPTGRIVPLLVVAGARVGAVVLTNVPRLNAIGIAIAEIFGGASMGVRLAAPLAAVSAVSSVSPQCVTAAKATQSFGHNIALKYKTTWSVAQKLEADQKVAALNAATLTKSPAMRGSRSAAAQWDGTGASRPSGYDVDHIVDLQLGGLDDLGNMWLLNSSVNRSLGSQIAYQIKTLPIGSRIGNISISERR